MTNQRNEYGVIVIFLSVLGGWTASGGADPLVAVTGAPRLEGTPLASTTLKLEKVWEWQSPKPVMEILCEEVTLTVGEAKAKGWVVPKGLKDTDAYSILRPRVGVNHQEHEVYVFEPEGTPGKTISLDPKKRESVLFSPSNRYFAIRRETTDLYAPGGSVWRTDGTPVWSKEEGPSVQAISNQGKVLAFFHEEEAGPPKEVFFYDASGFTRLSIKNPLAKEGMGYGAVGWSIDGNFGWVAFNNSIDKTSLHLIDAEGQVQWAKAVPFVSFKRASEVALLPLEGIAGLGDQPLLYWMDWNGNIKWKKDMKFRGHVLLMSKDFGRLFVMSAAGYVWSFNYKTGEQQWEYRAPGAAADRKSPWPYSRSLDMKILNNTIFVHWSGSQLLILNATDGRVVDTWDTPTVPYQMAVIGKYFVWLNCQTSQVKVYEVR